MVPVVAPPAKVIEIVQEINIKTPIKMIHHDLYVSILEGVLTFCCMSTDSAALFFN